MESIETDLVIYRELVTRVRNGDCEPAIIRSYHLIHKRLLDQFKALGVLPSQIELDKTEIKIKEVAGNLAKVTSGSGEIKL